MNSRSAVLPMRSPLMSQFPRRSSDSQPNTAGTSGHFARLRATISSTAISSTAARISLPVSAIDAYLAKPWLAHYQKGVPSSVEVPLKSVGQAFDEATERAPD